MSSQGQQLLLTEVVLVVGGLVADEAVVAIIRIDIASVRGCSYF